MDRQVAYKFQGNAERTKAQRNKAVNVKRKELRCSIMMTNRRLPLEEKNQPAEVNKNAKSKEDRLERLKEWQKRRNALRELEKKKQLKPFYAGSCNTVPAFNVTIPNKPVTRLQVKNATTKFSVAQNQQKQTKPVQGKKVAKKQQEDTKSRKRPVGKSKVVQKDTMPSKAAGPELIGQDKGCNKEQPSKLAAPQVVAQGKKCNEEKKASPVFASDDHEPWISSSRKPSKPTNSNKTFQSEQPLSPFKFGAPSNTVTQSKPFHFNMKHKATSVFVNQTRGSSKECAQPSPLCFHYKAADDLMNTPQQQDVEEVLPLEDSLATVKRNCFHDPSNCDPIVVASQPPKDIKCNDTDSGNAGDDSSDSSDNEQDDQNKGAGHCDSKESAVEDEKDVALVPEDSSAAVTTGVSGATPRSNEVQRFKDLHEGTVASLRKQCEVWEKKAEQMTGAAAAEDSEDVLGRIRTAIGQAQLLVNKKLKQFLGLCHDAEEDRGERRTTPDDLQGFWDMVSHQIDDVKLKFLQLEEIEKNGWVVNHDVPKKKPMKKLRGPAKRKAESEVSEEQKQRLAEQREKRAAARNRLKEMKAAAKRVAEKEKPVATDDSVFDEFVSSVAVMELTTPKKKKGDGTDSCVLTQVRRSTRKTPNKYRRKSTVSRSSTSEENDAPIVVQANKALENTNLILFDSPSEPSQLSYSTAYDFSQYVTPPSPSETGCLRPTPYSLLSEDSLGHINSQNSTSN